MEKKSFSIKYRVLVWVFALLLPLVALVGVNAVLQVRKTYDQLRTSEGTSLRLLVSQLETETREVEEYLYDLVLQNRGFRSMAGEENETELYAQAYEVLEGADNLFRTKRDLSFLILYSEAGEYYAYRDNDLSYLPLADRTHLREAAERRFLRFFLQKNGRRRSWFTVQIAERWFLCRSVSYQGMYCAALFDLPPVAARLTEQMGEDCFLVFRDGDAVLTEFPLEDADWSARLLRLGGRKYAVLGESLCGMELTYLYPYDGLSGGAGASLALVLAVTAAVLLAIAIFYIQLRRDFFRPLDDLVETMRRIRDGETDALPESGETCDEFREVDRTFDQMLSQIRNLKIEHYEKELRTQRAEMSFLQAQIRPHFYLNCLKVIYALAQQERYAEIKTCILLVSRHLRYALGVRSDTVTLHEELEMCENYVHLCGVMSDVEPRLTAEVDEGLQRFAIPPVSLLSLMENSIRINLAPDRELIIRIRARCIRTEESRVLCLSVQDNGSGFTEEQLAWFNGEAWQENASTHVGLQNVARRFRILYGEEFSMAFFNRGGAVIELYLPMQQGEEGEHADIADR